jgi:hypothetical protein
MISMPSLLKRLMTNELIVLLAPVSVIENPSAPAPAPAPFSSTRVAPPGPRYR